MIKKVTMWVLRCTGEIYTDEYLMYVGGDWGPNHISTDDLAEAVLFDTQQDAMRYARECNWSYDGKGLQPVQVEYIPAQFKLV